MSVDKTDTHDASEHKEGGDDYGKSTGWKSRQGKVLALEGVGELERAEQVC